MSPGGRSGGTTLRQHAPGRHRLPLSPFGRSTTPSLIVTRPTRIASSSSAGEHSLIAFCLDGQTLEIELLTTRASCSPHLARSLTGAADCPDPHQLQRPQSMAGAAAIRSSETTAASLKSAWGEGIRVHWRVPAAGPPAYLHRYGRGRHDPLSLLRDAVPLRSSIDTARCRPARQFLW